MLLETDLAPFALKLTMWILADFLVLAALRLLLLITINDLPFIKQRLTAWLANLRLGLFLLALQAFLFNLAMALRLVVSLTESGTLVETLMHLCFILFEFMLLVALLVIGNVMRGGGPPAWKQFREITRLIDDLDQGTDAPTWAQSVEEELR